jgi:hypothetical protein
MGVKKPEGPKDHNHDPFLIRFCASFQPKLNELQKKLQNQQKYASFLVNFQYFLIFG